MRGCSHHSTSDAEPVTDDERLRREARHRAHQRMGFLHHLSVFIPVMLLILAIDVLTPDGWFIQWVAAIWGGILVIHFLYAFILDDLLGPSLEHRIFETQLTALEERARRR